MSNQNKLAGFAAIFGAMLLAVAVTMAIFLARGSVPPFLVVVLPAIIGAGLLSAGLVYKHDSGWNQNRPG